MPVENSETVDFLTVDRDTGTISLLLIEPRPWSCDAERVRQLDAKLTTYRAYVADGKLAKALPLLAGNPVVFELRCPGPPPVEMFAHLNHWGQKLREIGVQLDVSIPPPGHEGVVMPDAT